MELLEDGSDYFIINSTQMPDICFITRWTAAAKAVPSPLTAHAPSKATCSCDEVWNFYVTVKRIWADPSYYQLPPVTSTTTLLYSHIPEFCFKAEVCSFQKKHFPYSDRDLVVIGLRVEHMTQLFFLWNLKGVESDDHFLPWCISNHVNFIEAFVDVVSVSSVFSSSVLSDLWSWCNSRLNC